MRLFTIGFAGKSAEKFFTILRDARVEKLIDVRRSNNTLYCGFTRSRDLPYFLRHLCDIEYVHVPEFAPSEELLRDYQARIRKNRKDPDAWPEYVHRFLGEIAARPIAELFQRHCVGLGSVCLLCTEPTADKCHRRLLAEYIQGSPDHGIEVIHL